MVLRNTTEFWHSGKKINADSATVHIVACKNDDKDLESVFSELPSSGLLD
jgi:hypothetical protein